MTRKEAIEKITLPRWYGEDGQRGWLLDSLQALGLIIFTETENTPGKIFADNGVHWQTVLRIYADLEKAGLEIKKIQK